MPLLRGGTCSPPACPAQLLSGEEVAEVFMGGISIRSFYCFFTLFILLVAVQE